MSSRHCGWPVVSFEPLKVEDQNQDALINLWNLYRCVNDEDFRFFDEFVEFKVFALILPLRLVNWLRNTELATIQLQVLDYHAKRFCLPGGLSLGRWSDENHPLWTEASNFAKKEYAEFCDGNFWDRAHGPSRFRQHYTEVAARLTGGTPEFLEPQDWRFTAKAKEEWGLANSDGLFEYAFAGFNPSDWAAIIERGEDDPMDRSESDFRVFSEFQYTYRNYERTKDPLFVFRDKHPPRGQIYLHSHPIGI